MNIGTVFIQAYISALLSQPPSPYAGPAQFKALKQALKQVEETRRADGSFEKHGLVNVLDAVPDAGIDIKYSDTLNFTATDVYGPYCACHLLPVVTDKLRVADSLLKKENPELRFVFYDCARPVSVQERMWKALGYISLNERGRYLSNPKNHSVHNYGAAVDIALADTSGKLLDMGTAFDHFGPEAYPYMEKTLLMQGILTQEQVNNRLLLRKVMLGAGFRQQPFEWWHYNAMGRPEAKMRYNVLY
ncbi:MAG: M15 family metallopeptidase [Flavobacteriales bacterium]